MIFLYKKYLKQLYVYAITGFKENYKSDFKRWNEIC